MVTVDVDHLDLDPFERREVPGLAPGEVDGVEPPVLVAAPVLEVEQVAPVMGPEEVPDAPIAIVGDDGSLLRAINRGDPHVQHAIIRSDPAEAAAIGGDPRADPLGVAEQHLPGNDRDVFTEPTLGRVQAYHHGPAASSRLPAGAYTSVLIQTALTLRYSSRAWMLLSLPQPLILAPPKGMAGCGRNCRC